MSALFEDCFQNWLEYKNVGHLQHDSVFILQLIGSIQDRYSL